MPYLCHGRPQWMSPPRNSNAIPWVCASTYPRTSWNDEMPACGLPVMSISDSGKAVQPPTRTSGIARGWLPRLNVLPVWVR